MSFLYFVAQESDVKPSLDKHGLAYIVDSPDQLEHCPVLHGPGGQRGVVVGCRMDGRQVLYKPDLQNWRCIAGRWIGWLKNEDFRPDKFQRDTLLDGYDWKDWKGNVWKIPVARRHEARNGFVQSLTSLPVYYGVNDSGDFIIQGVQDKFKRLWDIATECESNRLNAMMAAIEKGESVYAYEVGDTATVLSVAIGTNYRLNAIELGLMGVVTDQTAKEVMDIVTDLRGWIELQKKIQHEVGTS